MSSILDPLLYTIWAWVRGLFIPRLMQTDGALLSVWEERKDAHLKKRTRP